MSGQAGRGRGRGNFGGALKEGRGQNNRNQQQNKQQTPKKDAEGKQFSKGNQAEGQTRAPRPQGNNRSDLRRTGIVRGVVSGDTVIVMEITSRNMPAPPVGEPPKEQQLTLQGLKAPMLGRRNADDPEKRDDQPYAWESREYLRKRLIGASIVYRVEHEAGGRQYGEIWLGSENIRFSIVQNGWANVIIRNKPKRADDDEEDDLTKLEEIKEKAKAAKKGMWAGKDNQHIRRINYREAPRGGRSDDLFYFFEKNQNKQLKGVVEQVLTGSTLRVLLISNNSMDEVQLLLAGVRCPTYKPNSEAQSEPFSREAKFFMEHVLLHRDVLVTLDSVDKYNTLYGTVTDVHGANVSLNLLQMGLASFVDWSAPKNAKISQYKESEKSAQDAKLRIWSLKQPPREIKPVPEREDKENKAKGQQQQQKPRKQEAGKETFVGQVVEIVNAGTITVRVNKGEKGKERWVDRKLTLSSIRPPRMPNLSNKKDDPKDSKDTKDSKTDENKETEVIPEPQPQPPVKEETAEEKETREKAEKAKLEAEELLKLEEAYAVEAKEWLRSTLIGKQVRCVFDYLRSVQYENVPKLFWSVYIDDKNVAVQLVSQGYATVVTHRNDEPRSADFQSLTMAEKAAKKAGRGLHGPLSKKPILHLNDLTSQKEVHKTKQFLTFLKKRSGNISAVVEHVYSSTRYKLRITSEACVINFSLIGCATERPLKVEGKQKDLSIYSSFPPNTAGNRAMHFARDNLHQRNVEIAVENVDKGGNFIGKIFLNRKDFAHTLLSEGHAKLFFFSAADNKNLREYEKFAAIAEKQKLGFYASREGDAKEPEREKKPKKERVQRVRDEDEEEEEVDTKDETGQQKQPKLEQYIVAITEILDGSSFFFQKIGEGTKQLGEMMNIFQGRNWESEQPFQPTEKFSYCAARFSADNLWYRARVTRLILPAQDPQLNEKKEQKDQPKVKPIPEAWEVEYIDYGNKEVVKSDRLRVLPKEFSTDVLERQSLEGRLVYVKAPALDKEYGKDAAAYFKELVWNKELKAQQFPGRGVAQLSLGDPKSKILVNAEMIMRGLAKVDGGRKTRGNKGQQKSNEFLKKLEEEEVKAKSGRVNMWQYGDNPDSEDEREEARLLR